MSKTVTTSIEAQKIEKDISTLTSEVLNPYANRQNAKTLRSLTVPSHLMTGRFETFDLMRGIALALMILAHTTKALLNWDQYPAWGLVPIHLITKFSSSLFILTFGATLAVAYLPYVGTPQWAKKRSQMWWRALEIMFWYKALTVVQMFQIYPREQILDALLFKSFPDFVEVLGFYSIALVWLPLFLPLWARLHWLLKPLLIFGFIYAQFRLTGFDFWGNTPIKAILVESRGYFTFGQISRGSLIIGGLIIGELYLFLRKENWGKFYLGLLLLSLGGLFLGMFYGVALENLSGNFLALAKNGGKHPPAPQFMFFSVGGALVTMSLCLFGGRFLNQLLLPLTIIGKSSLQAFIFHIVVIFVFYRYLFDLRHNTTYDHALYLSGLLILLTSLWVGILKWRR